MVSIVPQKQIDKFLNKKNKRCKLCGKTLKKIGLDRKNGRGQYKDWDSRKYHKKCFFLTQIVWSDEESESEKDQDGEVDIDNNFSVVKDGILTLKKESDLSKEEINKIIDFVDGELEYRISRIEKELGLPELETYSNSYSEEEMKEFDKKVMDNNLTNTEEYNFTEEQRGLILEFDKKSEDYLQGQRNKFIKLLKNNEVSSNEDELRKKEYTGRTLWDKSVEILSGKTMDEKK